MLSKGDLVRIRLALGGDPDGSKEISILGKMMNYSDEEDMYILEPKAISVHKDQVIEAKRLLEDFDFDNISEEMTVLGKKTEKEEPPDIVNIRVSKRR